jgi:hypothetical protein
MATPTTCALCRLPMPAELDRSVCFKCVPDSRNSQVRAVGGPPPKTWDDYEAGCLQTYGGGYQTGAEREIFRHGIATVFNLLRAEFPNMPWHTKSLET